MTNDTVMEPLCFVKQIYVTKLFFFYFICGRHKESAVTKPANWSIKISERYLDNIHVCRIHAMY